MPRRRDWVDTIFAILQDGTNVVSDLLVGAPDTSTRTSARIIGDLVCLRSDITAITGESQKLDMGICVVDTAAFVIGQSALPDPRVPDDSPPRGWLWRWTGTVAYQRSAGEPASIWMPSRVTFDVGGMRKIDRGKLVLITSKTGLAGSPVTVRISGSIRTLILT